MQFSFSASLWKPETGNWKLFLEDAVPRKVFLLAWRQQGCTTYYTETLVDKNRVPRWLLFPPPASKMVQRLAPLYAQMPDHNLPAAGFVHSRARRGARQAPHPERRL